LRSRSCALCMTGSHSAEPTKGGRQGARMTVAGEDSREAKPAAWVTPSALFPCIGRFIRFIEPFSDKLKLSRALAAAGYMCTSLAFAHPSASCVSLSISRAETPAITDSNAPTFLLPGHHTPARRIPSAIVILPGNSRVFRRTTPPCSQLPTSCPGLHAFRSASPMFSRVSSPIRPWPHLDSPACVRIA
jgi:hypothetical protein